MYTDSTGPEAPSGRTLDASPGQTLVEWLAALTRYGEEKPGRPPWPHASLQSFVQAEGRLYSSARLSPEERRLVGQVAKRHRVQNGPFRARHCFSNAQNALLLDRSRRFAYAEGFVLDGRASLPFMHGWLMLNGRVVDFTDVQVERPNSRSVEPPCILGEFKKRHYFGVEFCRDYVESRILETGVRGALIDDWENGFPLLRSTSGAWRRK